MLVKKRVVVVGGGFAGAYAARNLEKKFSVTLVDTKDYFEFTPGILRTLVDPRHMKKIQVLHSNYLDYTKFVHGRVTSFNEKEVLVGKKKIAYDYLLLCSGSHYASPIKEKNVVLPNRAHTLHDHFDKLSSAKKIVVVGGGVVGVELVGEILDVFPGKHITLLHSRICLLERCSSRAQNYVEKVFKKKGAHFIFEQRMLEEKDGLCVTDKGKSLKSDLCFLCTGITPNSEFVDPSLLNEKKAVLVNSFLQVKGHTHVFAVGDVNAVSEEKTAQGAEKQAEVAVQNVLRLDAGKKLIPYISRPRVMVISLGKYDGLLLYKNFVLTGWIPAVLKWFVEWKTMRNYR